jgi:hypothetical protein
LVVFGHHRIFRLYARAAVQGAAGRDDQTHAVGMRRLRGSRRAVYAMCMHSVRGMATPRPNRTAHARLRRRGEQERIG